MFPLKPAHLELCAKEPASLDSAISALFPYNVGSRTVAKKTLRLVVEVLIVSFEREEVAMLAVS